MTINITKHGRNKIRIDEDAAKMLEKTNRSGLIKQHAYRIFKLNCEPISLFYLKRADAYIIQYHPIRIMI